MPERTLCAASRSKNYPPSYYDYDRRRHVIQNKKANTILWSRLSNRSVVCVCVTVSGCFSVGTINFERNGLESACLSYKYLALAQSLLRSTVPAFLVRLIQSVRRCLARAAANGPRSCSTSMPTSVNPVAPWLCP